MKKIFCIVISIFLFMSCSQELTPECFTTNSSDGDENIYATLFLKKYHERPQGENELKQYLSNRRPLFEYTTIGQSDRYGLYYMIPLQNISSSTINSALIYPVDSRKNVPDKSYYGTLDASPSFFNANVLNEQIPVTARFLYSYHFLEWKKEGLKVLPALTSFAEKLDGKVIQIEGLKEFIPHTKGIEPGWSYDIMIRYEIVAKTGVVDGEATITQLHYELAEKAFKDCMYIFTTYPLPIVKMYGPHSSTSTTKLISLYYRNKVPDIMQLACQYMERVQAYTGFIFRYQASVVKIQGDYAHGGSSGGGSGSTTGGSGNNGGGEENNNAIVGPQGVLSKAIFSPQSTLTQSQWRKIEGILEYINMDCMGGKLVSSVMKKNILLIYDPNLKDKFGKYNPSDNTLTIRDLYEMKANASVERTFLHELIHCVQKPRSTSMLNNEIEAHVAVFMYASRTNSIPIGGKKYTNIPGLCLSIDHHYNIIDQKLYDQQYINVINDLRNNGYKNFPENSIDRNFNTVKQLSKDC